MQRGYAEIRQFVYHALAAGQPMPTPNEIALRFGTTPAAVAGVLQRLQDDHDALVLVPGSPYIWMAEPFSALPTDYPVIAGSTRWYGNCIWDALAIVALLETRARVEAVCPLSGTQLRLEAGPTGLVEEKGVVHFAVPARRWWESIGFT